MSAPKWSGRRVVEARRLWAATHLPEPCAHCGEVVRVTDNWVLGHKESRGSRPDLMFVVDNWQTEHRSCSNKTGQQGVIDKAKAEVKREADEVGKATVTPLRRPKTAVFRPRAVPSTIPAA